MKSCWGIALLATFALLACAAPTTLNRLSTGSSSLKEKKIFVMRHLQKEHGDDPSLSSEGAAAAERLGNMLAEKGISAIYATPTRRAMETAAPLSRMTGVAVSEYDPQNPESLVASVADIEGAVLVVGHSNTVPNLVLRFGGRSPPRLTEQDYGTVFLIDATGDVQELILD